VVCARCPNPPKMKDPPKRASKPNLPWRPKRGSQPNLPRQSTGRLEQLDWACMAFLRGANQGSYGLLN